MYTPTPEELEKNGFTQVAPSRWSNGVLYYHGENLEYPPCWTLGDW